MKKIQTLYIFDKYLNRTMNWAYRLMKHATEVQPIIASPLIVKNEFFDSDFDFIWSPFQIQKPDNEWDINSLQRGINYFSNRVIPLYQKYLFDYFKNKKIDIVHIYFGNVACTYLELVKKLDKPLVVSFLGYDYESIFTNNPEYREKYLQLFEYASLVLCLGKAGKERLIKNGCPEEKIQIFRFGVDSKEIPVFNRNKKTNSLKILQAGTITEKKGHIYTLEAFIKIQKICPHVELTILGEEEDVSIARRLKSNIPISLKEKIKFHGILPYNKFLSFSKNHDVLIHPSCTASNGDCESGTPLVIQSLMATGMPVISTRHADIENGVLHEKNGFLSEEKDVDGLVDSIKKFYFMGEEEYLSFCKSARQHVEANYQMSKSGTLLNQLYRTLI